MPQIEILSHFLGQMVFWMNDNLGWGDGTQHIREIFKEDPEMAEHLVCKWKEYSERAMMDAELGQPDGYTVQWLAFIHFIMGLSDTNRQVLVKYIAENGRSS